MASWTLALVAVFSTGCGLLLDTYGSPDSSTPVDDAAQRDRDSAMNMDGAVMDATGFDSSAPEDAAGTTDTSMVPDAIPPGDSTVPPADSTTCEVQPEVCNGVDDDCDGVADNGTMAYATSRGTSAYVICPGPVSQSEAQAACVSGGGHLAIIDDAFEDRFLHGEVALAIGPGEYAWIDLVDRALATGFGRRDWGWESTGVSMSYSAWADGVAGRFPASEPDNDGGDEHCVTKRGAAGYESSWFDQSCAEPRAYVCERPR